MNLIEESFEDKNEKKKSKAPTIILIAIVFIIFIIIGISAYLLYIQKTTLRVIFNGQLNEEFKQLLVIEENGVIYLPIKEVASYFDYESYNGEYGEKSEDQSKCYVQGKHEIVNLSLGSNEMHKLDLESNNENYEIVYIKEPIKAINGVLYASSEAIEEIFNINFEYNQQENKIYVYTIPYLVQIYKNRILNYGYTGISDVFTNQKALMDGIIIARNEKEKYGVIDNKGNTILEAKYDDILFLEDTGDFLVTDNKKKGILTKTRETKVQIIYDDIRLMDSKAELYVVKNENKYGVMDFNGNIKIYIENDDIGINNISSFEKNNIKSSYILADSLIPVKKGKYWGLFDKKGRQIVDFKYDSFGCANTNNREQLNLLVIPDYNVIVACKDKKYTLINLQGKELIGIVADSIYMTIDREEKFYYIAYNNNQYNAIEFLESIGITNSNNRTTENDSNSNEENEQQEKTNNEENSQESEGNQENENNDNNSDDNDNQGDNDNQEDNGEASEEQNYDEYSE